MTKETLTDLILVIGTNPLPNFVVADYMLKQYETIERIWLIHSEDNLWQQGTLNQGKCLEELIKANSLKGVYKNLKFPLKFISIKDVSDAQQIYADLNEKLKEGMQESAGFHFNYTGGTKSMSTHVYWFLKDTFETKLQAYSYLDARNFRIVDDNKKVLVDNLQKKVKIDFEDLIKLHGFFRINEDKSHEFMPVVDVFDELIQTDQINNFYSKDCFDRDMFRDSIKIDTLAKKISRLDKEKFENYRVSDMLMKVINAFPEEYRIFKPDGKLKDDIPTSKFDPALQFIAGEWLEDYIFQILYENLEKSKIQIKQDWVIKKKIWEKLKDAYFQLDVMMVYGYQLFGISCTTDQKKWLCKSKGFEIILRTRQIGGDEAKSILITFLDNEKKRTLQYELMYDTGGTKENILVLGIADLKKETFISEIKKFIFNK